MKKRIIKQLSDFGLGLERGTAGISRQDYPAAKTDFIESVFKNWG